tara:strand:- start:70 stop:267 length:198 start_codon:yes stop_codon:yes gene_type:complete
MKNILLFIVLGLFTVGCLDENPIGPGHSGSYWQCESTGWLVDDEEYCEYMCDGSCDCHSGSECDD